MDHWAIVRRAWDITWRYRMLWVFGVILAACSGAAGSGGGGGTWGGLARTGDWPNPSLPYLSPADIRAMLAVLVSVVLIVIAIAVVASIVSLIVRYLSETAIIRAVDDHESTGKKRSFGAILGLGWSRRAFRLFLIDLVVGLPAAIIFAILVGLSLTPLLLWVADSEALGILGTVGAIGLLIAVAILGILAALAWSLLQPFAWRAAALDDYGAIDAIGRGYAVVRARLRDAGLMWLLLAALQLAYGLVGMAAFIALGILGLLVGGLIGVGVFALMSLAFKGATPLVLGALAGLPFGVAVVALPMIFVSALVVVFKSSVWTLTYRELGSSVPRA